LKSQTKLNVLLKSLEIAEKQVVQEKLRIEEIADSRVAVLSKLIEERNSIYARLEALSSGQKRNLVGGSQTSSPAQVQAFRKRLTKDLETLKPKIETADRQFKSARERLELAENELLEARIERKKVEKLLDSKIAREQVKHEMVEERIMEELNSGKVRK